MLVEIFKWRLTDGVSFVEELVLLVHVVESSDVGGILIFDVDDDDVVADKRRVPFFESDGTVQLNHMSICNLVMEDVINHPQDFQKLEHVCIDLIWE